MQKLQLGESWVVEDEDEDQDEDEDYLPQDYYDMATAPQVDDTPPSYPTRGNYKQNQPPEPQLIMPSLDAESRDGSWADASRNQRRSSTRLPEKGTGVPEARRRIPGKQSRHPAIPPKRPAFSPSEYTSVQHTRSELQDTLALVVDHSRTMLSWLFDVLGGALSFLKKPISYLLAIWLLFGILVVMRNLVTSSIYAGMSPVCRLPGVSLLSLPFCPDRVVKPQNGAAPAVEFDQLMTVQSKFEEVLEDSAGSVGLPLDMKRSEASIRDLRQLVRYSQLHSKGELVLEFDTFVETARIASYDLQRFNSHVGRAVDSVIATTRWTTRVLDGIIEQESSRGLISAFINDKLLAPFQPIKFTETILLDQYIQHTRLVEEEINKLIMEAQALLLVLNNLEDRLDVIHGIATRDDMHAKALKEEILSELWSMVGGNRGKLNKMDRQLNLLQQVGMYRRNAYAHISGTILRLQAMGAGLEDLRERVGSPELLRDRVDIPLSVHMENIQKGVERLEEGRQTAKKLEDDHIRRTLERGRLEGGMIEA